MPPRPRVRLDVLTADLGKAASRERARALILAGRVRVDGVIVSKAGAGVSPDALIEIVEPDFPWVGRGGVKLAHALDAFGIDVSGREALDIGASTGGFTDVLLQRGARRVVALDVGHGQLDWRLREDPRVIVIERRNARALEPAWLPAPADVVTVDVSFISLRLILPVLPPIVAPGADIVVLVKPQFEAGRGDVKRGGIVRDPAVHDAVLARVSESAGACGLRRVAMTPSPIAGATGNREFLMHIRIAAPTDG
jgi:23S rRNA (cytidine1920-2'-O)/16S rRNA (cytidine1409-2'-O)-methyltransferase